MKYLLTIYLLLGSLLANNLNKGIEAYNKNDYQKAFKWISKAAQHGMSPIN